MTSLKELVEIIAKALVDNKDAVTVTESEEGANTVLTLSVADEDMGKVIGKQGRIAKAIRTVLKVAAIRADKRVTMDIEARTT